MSVRPYDWRGRGPDETVRCAECGDSGWVEQDESGDVRPCSTCRPDEFARWQGGHVDSAHDRYACDDPACKKLRSFTTAAVPRRRERREPEPDLWGDRKDIF